MAAMEAAVDTAESGMATEPDDADYAEKIVLSKKRLKSYSL
jgi:hypothetical protein